MQISLMQNVTSTAVNSSNEAEQKKAVDKPAKSQQRGHQKTQRLLQQIRKINNTSQGKGKKSSSFLFYIQFIIQLLY